MATPVEVSFVKISDDLLLRRRRIQGLGGIFCHRPWYMSEQCLIAEAERPEATRAWNFYVQNGTEALPLIVAVHAGRKYLTTPGEDAESPKLIGLPPLPPAWERQCA
jgi:hypothetical protein